MINLSHFRSFMLKLPTLKMLLNSIFGNNDFTCFTCSNSQWTVSDKNHLLSY